MVRVTFVSHDGTAQAAEAAAGTTLMEAAKAQDVPGIDAVCGGNCYCGTCRVHVPPAWRDRLTPPETFELELLAATGESETSDRLSCQITLADALDGLIVHIPERQF